MHLKTDLIFVFLFFLFLPRITSSIQVHYHKYIIPQSQLSAGETLIFDNLYEGDFYLGSKKFEQIGDKHMAIVGLHSQMVERITWVPPINKKNIFERLFSYKNSSIYVQSLLVNKPPLENRYTLRLPSSTWQRVNNDDRLQKERIIMRDLLQQSFDFEPKVQVFQQPLDSFRVSRFASPRNLPDGRAYYHAGVDLRARVPTPLKPMGEGIVVFADYMLSPGNMIVIYHGAGIFSRYMHLSRMDVGIGDIVDMDQIIGLTGATGRVEAPHLHWEVLWKGQHAHPENFIQFWNRKIASTPQI